MKKESITIQMESEKLKATKRYMEKKEVSIEQELEDAVIKLYEKYVPAPVREYIDETGDAVKSTPKSTKTKPKQSVIPTQEV